MNLKYYDRTLISLFLVVCGGACSNTKPADTPPPNAAALEVEFQNQDDPKGEIRAQARQAVLDFVSRNLSTWSVKGMSSQRFYQNVFDIDADLEKDGKHFGVTFFTEKFFPESGEPYWLAIPVNKFTRERLRRLSDDELLKLYSKARQELDDLQSPPEDDQ